MFDLQEDLYSFEERYKKTMFEFYGEELDPEESKEAVRRKEIK